MDNPDLSTLLRTMVEQEASDTCRPAHAAALRTKPATTP